MDANYASLLRLNYYCWQYFFMHFILHMYAVNTTTSTLKSAGMTEVTFVPSPSCTVQGTYTNVISCNFLWQTLNSKTLLFFFFFCEMWIGA